MTVVRAALLILACGLGAFAGWTAGSVPLTLAGADWSLIWVAVAMAFLGAFGGLMLAPALSGLVVPEAAPLPERLAEDRRGMRLAVLVTGGAATLAAAAWFVMTSEASPLWGVLVISALAGVVLGNPPPPPGPTEPMRVAPAAALALALLIIALYVVVSRPDADDAFYLNLPIGLKAGGAMMAADTMMGEEGWPLLGANYRVEALPTLVAALSAASGIPVVHVAHGGLPLLWCILFAAVLLVIGAGLAGRQWWVLAGLTLAFGLIWGGSLQTWGVHLVSRFFHGKGPLLAIVIPLIVFVVLRHRRGAVGTGPALLALLGLQTAALGLTANAVYLAPLALGLPLAAGVLADGRAGLLRLPLVLSAAPPLLAGGWLVLFDRPPTSFREPSEGPTVLGLWNMASDKPSLAFLLAVILAAALGGILWRRGKWVSAYVAVAAMLVFNPLLWPIYGEMVTGRLNFRLWWAIPVPVLAALGVVRLLPPSRIAGGVAVTLAALVALALPSSLLRMPGTTIAPGLVKLPPGAEIARRAAGLVPEGSRILAPEHVAEWLVVREDPPRPVFVRRLYLLQGPRGTGNEQREARARLADWVEGAVDLPPGELAVTLDALCVGLVVSDAANHARVGTALARLPGKEVTTRDTAFHLVTPACEDGGGR